MDGTAIVAIILSALTLVAVWRLSRAVTRLQRSVDDLANGAATVEDLKGAVVAALEPEPEPDPEPVRVSRVPAALRTDTVIKAMALGTGTAHAARRLRSAATNGNGPG